MGETYTCPWCRAQSDATSPACPRCGAPVDVRLLDTDSGWQELPPVRDMVRIQFGQSHCQVEGALVPVVDVALAAGDWVYFGHHVLLWKDPATVMQQMSMRGGWKRMLAGMPVHMMQAQGPGRIAFSADLPGEVVALPIDPGGSVDVREHMLLWATGTVAYDYEQSSIFYTTANGNEQETHWPIGYYLDRFSAPQQPGLLVLHAPGNVFVRTLQPGEMLMIAPDSFVYKDESVAMNLHIEQPQNAGWAWGRFGSRSTRYLWLGMTGPGRVAVTSACRREDPSHPIRRTPRGTTEQRW